MRRLIDILFVVTMVVLVAVALRPTDDGAYMSLNSVRLLMFSFFLFFYWQGTSASKYEKEANTADMDLPRFARYILFLGHPNPFRRRTVIFKIILLITSSAVFVMILIIPDSPIMIVIPVWLFGMVAATTLLFHRYFFGRKRKK